MKSFPGLKELKICNGLFSLGGHMKTPVHKKIKKMGPDSVSLKLEGAKLPLDKVAV